jgi:pimeloyl-ACP methyl ester carboxylesterase
MIQVRKVTRSGQANGLEALTPEHLKRVTAPVLLLVGEHDAEPYLAACRSMMAHIPGASAATILNAGHFVNVEQPETFNRLALEFLAGLG